MIIFQIGTLVPLKAILPINIDLADRLTAKEAGCHERVVTAVAEAWMDLAMKATASSVRAGFRLPCAYVHRKGPDRLITDRVGLHPTNQSMLVG